MPFAHEVAFAKARTLKRRRYQRIAAEPSHILAGIVDAGPIEALCLARQLARMGEDTAELLEAATAALLPHNRQGGFAKP